jgi:hypothetical protein
VESNWHQYIVSKEDVMDYDVTKVERLSAAIEEACKRMRTRPSVLGRTIKWFAETMDPYESTAHRYDPSLWAEVFLKLDHDIQLRLLNDERDRTAARKQAIWLRIKPMWMR